MDSFSLLIGIGFVFGFELGFEFGYVFGFDSLGFAQFRSCLACFSFYCSVVAF